MTEPTVLPELVVVECPECGTKATVREDGAPALRERWRQQHAIWTAIEEAKGADA